MRLDPPADTTGDGVPTARKPRAVSDGRVVSGPMSARDEIMTLINRYCFTLDTGDQRGMAEMFEHGEWTVEGAEPCRGTEEVMAALAHVKMYPDGTPRTKHLNANVELDIDEEAGTATGQCYIAVFQQTDEYPLQANFVGHYFDEFERVDGTWRWKRRLIRNPLIGDLSANMEDADEVVPGA